MSDGAACDGAFVGFEAEAFLASFSVPHFYEPTKLARVGGDDELSVMSEYAIGHVSALCGQGEA